MRRSPAWMVGIVILTPPPKFPLALALPIKLTVGIPPTPLRAMLCGLPGALSVMLTLAVRVPLATGVKVTLRAHLAPAASVLGLIGQVVVSAKSPALMPVSAILSIVSAAVPVLVSLT